MLPEIKQALELEKRVGRRVYYGGRGGYYYLIGKRKCYVR